MARSRIVCIALAASALLLCCGLGAAAGVHYALSHIKEAWNKASEVPRALLVRNWDLNPIILVVISFVAARSFMQRLMRRDRLTVFPRWRMCAGA